MNLFAVMLLGFKEITLIIEHFFAFPVPQDYFCLKGTNIKGRNDDIKLY